jgi:DNA-binding CsgD family transcriptional regulator
MTVQTQRRCDELVWRVAQAGDAADVFAQASYRLRRLVPFDAAAWIGTDPATGLPAGPTRVENLDRLTAEQCAEYWRRESTDADVIPFRQLARAPVPSGSLRSAVDEPRRSARYRTFLRPLGFGDELRAVLRDGSTPWGVVSLWRHERRPVFTQQELALVATLSEPIGHILRTCARHSDGPGGTGGGVAPGLLLFSRDGELISANEPARSWLDELPPQQALPTDHGVEVPLWIIAAVFHAAAVAHGAGDGVARVRVRSRRGSWLTGVATCLRRADGSFGDVAVVLTPAQPAEIAPIIVEAHDLTEREQQITLLITKGASTAEIAARLFLSRHTVRDHIKAILHKVGVSSRGELVAKVFAEHYQPTHLHDAVHVDTGEWA